MTGRQLFSVRPMSLSLTRTFVAWYLTNAQSTGWAMILGTEWLLACSRKNIHAIGLRCNHNPVASPPDVINTCLARCCRHRLIYNQAFLSLQIDPSQRYWLCPKVQTEFEHLYIYTSPCF
ncbi:hypothetical protein EJ05DRAFT_227073 [Pseudovirgaria hyperparasitica]|uniref:Uncharacterized protein n=1 Tax=Pseudovirgaria hyperparasitica TaxID=470096 RepID=A0A6A6VTU9_9PEZI|nr:uncharacterized protein EJ05DRAFT_227073 [Pseudovirgaria hyperparasitica]KAF2753154.1 hypothetical protein EJ05DRAFT_227073 [Pseudovirgaria hyperparasitica]